MIYVSMTKNSANLWWDKRSEFTEDCLYKITINNRDCVYTKDFLYFVNNLRPDTEYKFMLEVVDKDGNVLGKNEEQVGRTLPEEKFIDITVTPYNAVGDGKTDSTEIFAKAISDIKDDECLYIPEGVFICNRISIMKNVHIRFNSGASIITNKSEVL